MTILDAIVEHKRIEVLKRKQKRPTTNLAEFPFYGRKTQAPDLALLEQRPGIIAEFKRKSPSRGLINGDVDPVKVAAGYASAGASIMSILTDRNFFGGSFQDLQRVRESQEQLPLLRKDFIIDPYQLHEASAYGADLVLLIASILEKNQVAELAAEARSLGMQVLFEVHSEEELDKYDPSIGFVGVNNRDLKTFRVDTDLSLRLIKQMPAGVTAVSESGLQDPEEIQKLYRAGYRLFLMGEAFMKEKNPGEACARLIAELAHE